MIHLYLFQNWCTDQHSLSQQDPNQDHYHFMDDLSQKQLFEDYLVWTHLSLEWNLQDSVSRFLHSDLDLVKLHQATVVQGLQYHLRLISQH